MKRGEDRLRKLYDWRDGPDVDPPLVLLSALNLLGIAAFVAALCVFAFIVAPWLWGKVL